MKEIKNSENILTEQIVYPHRVIEKWADMVVTNKDYYIRDFVSPPNRSFLGCSLTGYQITGINLYNLNPRGAGTTLSQRVHPFVIKNGSYQNISTDSSYSYYGYGDIIEGDYPLRAILSYRLYFDKTDPNWDSPPVHYPTISDFDSNRVFVSSIKNILRYYANKHYIYQEYLDNFNWEESSFSIIDIPKIYYGNRIKEGSLSFLWRSDTTLIGEAYDSEGKVIQKGGANDGEVIGIILYYEGVIIINADWILNGSINDGYLADRSIITYVNPKWLYFFQQDQNVEDYYKIEFEGVDKVYERTLLLDLSENLNNFSLNKTYYKGKVVPKISKKRFIESVTPDFEMVEIGDLDV